MPKTVPVVNEKATRLHQALQRHGLHVTTICQARPG